MHSFYKKVAPKSKTSPRQLTRPIDFYATLEIQVVVMLWHRVYFIVIIMLGTRGNGTFTHPGPFTLLYPTTIHTCLLDHFLFESDRRPVTRGVRGVRKWSTILDIFCHKKSTFAQKASKRVHFLPKKHAKRVHFLPKKACKRVHFPPKKHAKRSTFSQKACKEVKFLTKSKQKDAMTMCRGVYPRLG